MWILLAFASAFFAGLTSILAKCGIKRTPSETATAIRTGVVLAFAWIMVFIVGSQSTITDISVKSWVFLILSGLATGGSWLCYFRALSIGDVNKVVPIDKSSTVLTMLLAFILFPDTEKLTAVKAVAMVLIAVGTYMMIEKKKQEANGAEAKSSNSYLVWALASALFASLTSILGKMGIDGVESNLGTAIRTAVVLLMAWTVVLVTGKAGTVKAIPRRELGFICLSGLATGASWLCFYRALQDGLASVVVPIDKLSILVSIGFSRVVFKERLSRKAAVGLAIIVVGTLMMVITPNSVKSLFAAIFGGVK
ncbi:MAG: EamA family transporter [Eubacteriales bacterium]|nr:EamA family transporter [Clostridiales bacterium]MDY5860869.1 EamA family transporter [Eubacteriales bacterium]HCG68364.1 multidrug DMT transporter permease [Clostridiales bacterium]